ncbi:MAG: pantoate--beta-alanine ligase [Gammaproteobacteria bacterium HGW-Gammaproteobacteria-3]|nr:MAG: pantoate--beta-alanine ligase [Gammaproteobacteria bacterium HGW-Gammaproteobacteria-3]
MLSLTTVESLREAVKTWRTKGNCIALVPTMGNLHAGHVKLVEAARKKADKVVVSIFVNPTQFGAGEDYETYPRTEKEDKRKLEAAAVDGVFLPSVRQMYEPDAGTVVSVPTLSGVYCGASRRGHFDGVATVVTKLFNLVQPDSAFFGEKDFQQLAVIRALVRDLNFPVTLHGVVTVREADGLAMSSRNSYLSAQQRQVAPLLYQALCQARTTILSGASARADIERQAVLFLQEAGFQPEYFSVCRASDLKPAADTDTELVILAAAKLGTTRLIDNVCFSR